MMERILKGLVAIAILYVGLSLAHWTAYPMEWNIYLRGVLALFVMGSIYSVLFRKEK